jgi:hypothetical protein
MQEVSQETLFRKEQDGRLMFLFKGTREWVEVEKELAVTILCLMVRAAKQ